MFSPLLSLSGRGGATPSPSTSHTLMTLGNSGALGRRSLQGGHGQRSRRHGAVKCWGDGHHAGGREGGGRGGGRDGAGRRERGGGGNAWRGALKGVVGACVWAEGGWGVPGQIQMDLFLADGQASRTRGPPVYAGANRLPTAGLCMVCLGERWVNSISFRVQTLGTLPMCAVKPHWYLCIEPQAGARGT